MARYKPIHKGLKLLPVDFDQQVIPGSFERHLVDHELDLTEFHARYKNDDEGAPAFDPAAIVKIILLAYSRGIISSRKMESAPYCDEPDLCFPTEYGGNTTCTATQMAQMSVPFTIRGTRVGDDLGAAATRKY